MTRQQPTDPDRHSGGPEHTTERSATAEHAAGGKHAAGADRAAASERDSGGEEWADEAAQARTASDPRRVTPHDRSGVPSTGDAR